MNIFIVSDQAQKSQFIQSGLKFENLDCQVIFFHREKDIVDGNLFYGADGLFLFFDDPFFVEKFVDEILKSKSHLPIIVLSQNYHHNFFELLHQRKKIRNYFTRPFPFRLMASEMRSNIFQEKEGVTQKILSIRDLELNRETRDVKLQGESLHLSQREYAFLEFLMLNAGKVLSRQIILEQVWDRNADIFTNTIDVHVNKLRKKMGENHRYIKTIPRVGYMLL